MRQLCRYRHQGTPGVRDRQYVLSGLAADRFCGTFEGRGEGSGLPTRKDLMMKPSHRATITFTMATCSLVTLAALVAPGVRFSYRLPGMPIALQVAAALVALLAPFLVAGRFIRSSLL